MPQGEAAKSASRALDVIDHFDAVRRPQRLKDVTDRLGFPPSSTDELLKALVGRGYLNFHPGTREYSLSMKSARIGSWLPPRVFFDGRLEEAMGAIAAATGEMVAVATVSDLFCDVVRLVHGEPTAYVPDTAIRAPVVQSAMGCVWLSAESDDRVERIYRRSTAGRLVDRERLTLGEVLRRVARGRGRDVVALDSLTHADAMLVAANLSLGKGERVVLSVGGPRTRILAKLDAIVALLGGCRAELSVSA